MYIWLSTVAVHLKLLQHCQWLYSSIKCLCGSVEDLLQCRKLWEMHAQLCVRKISCREEMATQIQYSHPGYLIDREAWWAAVHRVTKVQTRLSEHNIKSFEKCCFRFPALSQVIGFGWDILPLLAAQFLLVYTLLWLFSGLRILILQIPNYSVIIHSKFIALLLFSPCHCPYLNLSNAWLESFPKYFPQLGSVGDILRVLYISVNRLLSSEYKIIFL